MSQALTLAHLSDIHLAPLPRFALRYWNAKRGLGYLNWRRKRRAAHQPAVLARLLADLATQATDHIAVTGDLVNIALPAEYEAALGFLERLGPPQRVSVIPGNHDIYTRLRGDPGIGRWVDYMTALPAPTATTAPGPAAPPTFPYVRRLGPVALIGLNSAHPTPPFVAAGRLGSAQLAALAGHLDRTAAEGLARVVLIHHPPLPGQAKPLKALADAPALVEVLGRHGAELVLHGHNHRAEHHQVAGPGGPIPILGVPSASLGLAHGRETLAGYHIVRVERAAGGFAIGARLRGLETPDGPLVDLAHHAWEVARPRSA